MVSLMSDSRVSFLIWFIFVAIFVAVVLIFIETRMKKRKAERAKRRAEKTPIEKMKISLARESDVRKNLDLIGKTAKSFFKKEYGLSVKLDYAELIKKFEKQGNDLGIEFCDGMLNAYYSDNKIGMERVMDLGEMVEEIYKQKKMPVRISRAPVFGKKIGKFYMKLRNLIYKEIGDYIVTQKEKRDRARRASSLEDYECLKWVRKAIRMGYDRSKVSSLLKAENWDKYKIKKVLKVYNKEVSKVSRKNISSEFYSAEGGVAQRIVQKEKDLLGGLGAHVK